MSSRWDTNRWNASFIRRKIHWIRWREYSGISYTDKGTFAAFWLRFHRSNSRYIYEANEWPQRCLSATRFRTIQSRKWRFVRIHGNCWYHCTRCWTNAILFLRKKCRRLIGRKGLNTSCLLSWVLNNNRLNLYWLFLVSLFVWAENRSSLTVYTSRNWDMAIVASKRNACSSLVGYYYNRLLFVLFGSIFRPQFGSNVARSNRAQGMCL